MSDAKVEYQSHQRKIGEDIQYGYADELGKVLYVKIRKPDKAFYTRRADTGELKLGEVRRVLYRLPEIVNHPDKTVYVCEGEKDAENLAALGFVTTTNLEGASGKWRAEYSEPLRKRHVVILPDHDGSGNIHAEGIANALAGIASSVRIVKLPDLPEKGDVSDWIDAGGTREQLEQMVTAAPEWQAKAKPEALPKTSPLTGSTTERLPSQPKSIHDVLIHFPDARAAGDSWKAHCPAHPDAKPSLSISEGGDGQVLIHCHAGCDYKDVLAAVNLEPKDLYERDDWQSSKVVDPTLGGWAITGQAGLGSDAEPAIEAGKAEPADEDDEQGLIWITSDMKPQRTDWLWQDRFPLGNLSMIYGDGGSGKSHVTFDMVATVTQGRAWVDGTPCPKGKAIIISAEDNQSKIVERLKAAGADMDRKVALRGMVQKKDRQGKPYQKMFSLSDIPTLERDLERVAEVKLVVIDPVGAFMDGKDSHKDAEVKGLLAPLIKLAEKYNVAIVMVAHQNKARGVKSIHRVIGSVAFSTSVRQAFFVGKNPRGEGSVMTHEKYNWSAPQPSLAFELESTAIEYDDGTDGLATRVKWTGETDVTADEIEVAETPVLKRDEAKDWLESVLSKGPVKSDQITKMGRRAGHSEKTLRRAKKELGVTSDKLDYGPAPWAWFPPGHSKESLDDDVLKMDSKPEIPNRGSVSHADDFDL